MIMLCIIKDASAFLQALHQKKKKTDVMYVVQVLSRDVVK